MADAIKLVNLGTPPELAKELARQIDGAAGAVDVIGEMREKPEIQALTSESTAADIVAALQA